MPSKEGFIAIGIACFFYAICFKGACVLVNSSAIKARASISYTFYKIAKTLIA
jgi:hypothetical protein